MEALMKKLLGAGISNSGGSGSGGGRGANPDAGTGQ
jgi:hypothetical protein